MQEHHNNGYESIIQKLEGTIRQHIRVEQQQRLHIESLTQKIEELITDKNTETKNLNEKIKHLERKLAA